MLSVNAKGDTAELLIFGDIGAGDGDWMNHSIGARDVAEQLSTITASTVKVRINSSGGSVSDGLAIYSALRRHPAAIHVSIDGIAASIASLIAMAGDYIEMSTHGMLMIHAPWSGGAGNSRDMREWADVLDKYASAMATIYSTRLKGGKAAALALLQDGEDHYYDAQEALNAGLVDRIIEAPALAAHQRIPRHSAERLIDMKKLSNIQLEEYTMQGTNAGPLDKARIEAAAIQRERERVAAIEDKFARFAAHEGMAQLRAACLRDPTMTPERAGERILAKMAEGAGPIQGSVNFHLGEPNARREDKVRALLARAGVPGVQAGEHNPYRGHRLIDFARESLEANGMSTSGMDGMRIMANALTQGTSDFPMLLEDAMHKALQASYGVYPSTWSRFCSVGSVSDFRDHNRYRLGTFGNLDPVAELGEFRNKAIPDAERSRISVSTVGNIINLSRQAMINDDLGAFSSLAAQLGQAAAMTVEAAPYLLLAENGGLGPVLGDGKTLFHADHGNIGTGSALTMLGIDADRVKMGRQTDPAGNALYLSPAKLLVPMELGGTAKGLNASTFDPDASNKLQKPNIVNGLFDDVIDTPRLSGTRRYLFANPQIAPAIEVAFLNGQQEPYLEMEEGFDVDGVRWKVRLDFGVAVIDYRGTVTNAGA